MINITDLSIIICGIFFIVNGASRGFLRSLVGPIAFILGSLLGVLAYQMTKNILASFLVAIIGPILLGWVLSGLLNLWYPDKDWTPNPISQVFGGLITFFWGMIFVCMVVVFLSIMPQTSTWMTTIHDDLVRSYCYNAIKPFIDTSLLPTNSISNATPAQSQNDVQIISKDARFQEVIKDPEVQKNIQEKNYAALMSNPKVMKLTQDMMQDPEMFKRLMRAAQHPPQLPSQVKSPEQNVYIKPLKSDDQHSQKPHQAQ